MLRTNTMLRFNPRKSRLCKLKTCRARFIPAEPWEWWCCVEHRDAIAEEKRQARNRKELREYRATHRKLSWYCTKAKQAFHAWVRLRDEGKCCVSCDTVLVKRGAVGGDYDAGHFRSVGSAKHLEFDERNVHGQCKSCNDFGAGAHTPYRKTLIQRIGKEQVEALEDDNEPRNLRREDYEALYDLYRQKTKELKAQR